jgi:outer membrane protein OmpA-like peptidoglycan-associated protein
VPTTPIESTSLDGADETTAEQPAETAAAGAETTTAGEDSGPPPEATPVSDPQTAETPAPAAGTDATDEQTAAKPPIDGMVRLTFEPDSSVLSDAAKAQLDPLVARLNSDYLLRVQVCLCHGDEDASSSRPRRRSRRALAMRNYLTAQASPWTAWTSRRSATRRKRSRPTGSISCLSRNDRRAPGPISAARRAQS